MKGIVFSEFAELVEERFSPEILDEIIMESDLPSGGAYTSVGTYDHTEMVQLVVKLSEKTDTSVSALLHAFGKHLLVRFTEGFPSFFEEAGNVFDFLKKLDNHIHVEVRKLYPDADLPKFSFDDSVEGRLIMEYESERGFADLAFGLMEGCVEHYGEDIKIEKENVEGETHVKFHLIRQ